MYGTPETTTGGKALKFYATIRIDVRKSDPIKNGKEIIGNRTKIKVVKNKVSPPFRNCVVDMLYGEGISRTGEILDFGVEMDLIKKAGAFYSYKEVRIGQGRDNARQYILEHPVIFDELDTAIREKMIAAPIPAPVIADNEEAPSEDDVEFVLDDDISEEELEAAV